MTALGLSQGIPPGAPPPMPPRRLIQTDEPSFWVFIGLTAVAAVALIFGVVQGARSDPSVLLAGVFWAIFAVAGYWVIGRADLFGSVPVDVRLGAFAWGGLCLMFSGPLVALLGWLVRVPPSWAAAVHAPVPEEALKLLGPALIAAFVPAVFSRPLGAIVCGMYAGLGFTVIESWFQANSMLVAGNGESLPTALLLQAIAAPWAHSTFTAVALLGVWYAAVHPQQPRAVRIVVGVVFFAPAVALHGFADSAGSAFGSAATKVAFLVALLGILFILLWWARRVEGRWFRDLTAEGLPAMSADEAVALATRQGRRGLRKQGAGARLLRTQLQYANAYSDNSSATARELGRRIARLRGPEAGSS